MPLPLQYSVSAGTAGYSVQLSNHPVLNYWLQSQLQLDRESKPGNANFVVQPTKHSATEITELKIMSDDWDHVNSIFTLKIQ